MLKNCIEKSVNELETQSALKFYGRKNSKIYEKYRLASNFSNEFIINVLENKFMYKMNCRKFIWRAMKLKNDFEQLTLLYFETLKWITITIKKKFIVIKIFYLSQYASVSLSIDFRLNIDNEKPKCLLVEWKLTIDFLNLFDTP